MQELDHKTLKELFFNFFESKQHAIIKDFSLVPENDASEGLFTLAGMHPLVPYLMGEKHKDGTRLANVQRCIRTNDIEEVGDSTHMTFFEMMGNWSLGDYFKQESITWSYEFLTSKDYLGIEHDKLWVSVFEGDDVVPKDDESIEIWKSLGIDENRIMTLPADDNWWAAGENGPCGPDTEIFYDTTGIPCGDKCAPGHCECSRFVEIWNNVFMCYNKQDGVVTELAMKNVDTGMGLERVLYVLNGYRSNYETSVLKPIYIALIESVGKNLEEVETDDDLRKAFRIMTDHLRAATFIIGDINTTSPGNQGRSYVLRRLIRRAFRYCNKIGVDVGLWISNADKVVETYAEYYPELLQNKDLIKTELLKESEKFATALENGIKFLNKALPEAKVNGVLAGEVMFKLYDTYGFPVEVTIEIAAENELEVEIEKYEQLLEEHKEKSRASAGQAKSGLVEENEMTTKYHTLTHLLHAALRDILGTHVEQKGSNITGERLRFDFSHDSALTAEQIAEVEAWVQGKIEAGLPVTSELMTYEEAVASGALGLFKDRYVEEVSVYTIGDVSKEICRGPHVENTSELSGTFKIQKEESSSGGVRRIKAILQ